MSDKHLQRAKIIEKVRALLTMTVENGCTEAEAMTAAAMAAKLMEEYDLATTDVRSVQDERIARQSAPFRSTENHRQMHPAGIYVAVAVGEFFDCKCWRNHTDIIFFGLKHDVDLAHIMLAMIRFAMDRELIEFLKRGSKKGEHPRSVAASFARGMCDRIRERLRELKAQRTANVKAKGQNLVVPKREIIDAEFAKLFGGAPFKKAKPSKPTKSADAYVAGVIAGDRVALGCEPKINRATRAPHQRQNSAAAESSAVSSTGGAAAAAAIASAAAASPPPSTMLTLGRYLAGLGTAGVAILRSYLLIAVIFLQLVANRSLLPDGATRALLWLDAQGALALLAIAILVLIPSVHLYSATDPTRITSRTLAQ